MKNPSLRKRGEIRKTTKKHKAQTCNHDAVLTSGQCDLPVCRKQNAVRIKKEK